MLTSANGILKGEQKTNKRGVSMPTPRTPLFPKAGEKIKIKQGHTGDCYLLTTLDCLLQIKPQGRQLLQSLFVETATGVELRIKKNPHSEHIKLKKAARTEKYDYQSKNINGELYDTFFIPNEKLEKIDSGKGVESNSLAVKILENMVPYYFLSDLPEDSEAATMIAHRGRETAAWGPIFIGDLLNIKTVSTENIQDVLLLKAILPQDPVYVGMQYVRGRHALRLKKLSSDIRGYSFVLVNPADNEKTEAHTYSQQELIDRGMKFGIFCRSEKRQALIEIITQLSDQTKKIMLDMISRADDKEKISTQLFSVLQLLVEKDYDKINPSFEGIPNRDLGLHRDKLLNRLKEIKNDSRRNELSPEGKAILSDILIEKEARINVRYRDDKEDRLSSLSKQLIESEINEIDISFVGISHDKLEANELLLKEKLLKVKENNRCQQ